MAEQEWLTPFPWALYSKKMMAKIDHPWSVGFFTEEEASEREMRLVFATEGSVDEENVVQFYWLVDLEDGIIADAKFQVYGHSALIAAAEASCDLVIGKNYDQAGRLNADMVDASLRDKSDLPAFPKETYTHLNLVLGALDQAAQQCEGIPFAKGYVSPVSESLDLVLEGEGYPGWPKLNYDQKISMIKDVVDKEIRPYVELDEGGIDVLDFKDDHKVIVAYSGACTTCFSATGATLSAVQQILRAKLSPNIDVIPEM
ncbi:NifU family protein [Simkania negevensis]|uniref:Nitrogen fixation protein NifU n=1 Tax=Simkania negevensis TaxID=83561 RepID=A0ABS3APZ4_9BACT|nr:NifU family protein [Simkania negevensis]